MQGVTQPRIFTPPKRRLTRKTTLGFAFIDFCESILGIELLPWQQWLAKHSLEIDEDGHFVYQTVVVEVARQNGKTTMAKAMALFFLFGLQVRYIVGTAQNLDSATEVWEDAIADIEDNEELALQVENIKRGNNGKSLVLTNGAKYRVLSSNKNATRGRSCDFVLIDELREQTDWSGWSAISGTTTARPNAMMWCMSNAGDETSVVLKYQRLMAMRRLGDPDGLLESEENQLLLPPEDEDSGTDRVGYFEWSAPPDCSPNDREGWKYANPSLGYGFLTEDTLINKYQTMPEPKFRTEHLCQWVLSIATPPFGHTAWQNAEECGSKITGDMVFGLDMSEDRTKTALAVCGKRDDGLYHVELIQYRVGFTWAVDWLTRRAKKHPIKVALQARGCPVASYLTELKQIEDLEVVECEGRDLGAWTGRFFDAVMANDNEAETDAVPLKHLRQPYVDKPAMVAQKRSVGDGAWAWDRRNSVEDISPLMAETMAFGLFTAGVTENKVKYKSSYNNNGSQGLIMV